MQNNKKMLWQIFPSCILEGCSNLHRIKAYFYHFKDEGKPRPLARGAAIVLDLRDWYAENGEAEPEGFPQGKIRRIAGHFSATYIDRPINGDLNEKITPDQLIDTLTFVDGKAPGFFRKLKARDSYGEREKVFTKGITMVVESEYKQPL